MAQENAFKVTPNGSSATYTDGQGDRLDVTIYSTGETVVTVTEKGKRESAVLLTNNAAKLFRNMLVNRFPYPADPPRPLGATENIGSINVQSDEDKGIEPAPPLKNVVLTDERGNHWLVRHAKSREAALNEIAHARVTGSIGGSTSVNGVPVSDVVRLTEAKPS